MPDNHPDFIGKLYRSQDTGILEAASELAAKGVIREQRALTQDIANQLALSSTAEEFCKRLVRRIVDFENGLDEAQEVGVKLVSFGQAVVFHVRDLGYHNPSLIVFSGETDDGNSVELIQHVSQISFLLMAVKRLEPEKPRSEMGFHALYKDLCE